MSGNDGIIHTFQQRRQLEDALAALAGTSGESVLQDEMQRLAATYPVEMLAAALLRHLGTHNSQLRGALGHLAALLPAAETTRTLRSVAADRHKSPQERTTAALILERYLNEPSPYALLADLAGDEDVPFQSLMEAVEESRQNRHILLEYVMQMQEHPADTAFMVLRLVDRLPPEERAELLRLIAQDRRPQVAHAALERLAAVAAADGGAGALRALHTLALALPEEEASGVRRTLRKLQFAGRRYQPPPLEGWRALMSPSDPGGYLSLWLVRQPGAGKPGVDDDGILLGFVLSLHAGILQFSGSEGMVRAYLPDVQPLGAMVSVGAESGHSTVLMEIPFAVGRWLVAQGQAAHRQRNKDAAVTGEYPLYNDLIWQFEAPQLPADVRTWWERSAAAAAGEMLPVDRLAEAAVALVDDPAMESWVRWGRAVWESVQQPRHVTRELPGRTLVNLLLREMERIPDHDNLLLAMAMGLREQTLWFALAGQEEQAMRAAQLAAAMPVLPLAENPFLAVLLEAGLQRLASQEARSLRLP